MLHSTMSIQNLTLKHTCVTSVSNKKYQSVFFMGNNYTNRYNFVYLCQARLKKSKND